MRNSYSHFFLYAKGHYQISDNIIDDLKKIQGHWSFTDPKYISDVDIARVLLNLAIDTIFNDKERSIKDQIFSFIADLDPDMRFRYGSDKNESFTMSIIKRSLSVLRIVQVFETDKSTGEVIKEFIPLDSPDPNILPLRIKSQKIEEEYVEMISFIAKTGKLNENGNIHGYVNYPVIEKIIYPFIYKIDPDSSAIEVVNIVNSDPFFSISFSGKLCRRHLGRYDSINIIKRHFNEIQTIDETMECPDDDLWK